MRPPSRSQLVGYAVLAVVVLAIGGRWLAARGSHPQPAGFGAPAPPPPRRVEVRTGGREAIVHVAGAVRRPGVYKLAAGRRVQDAIRCAGGPTGHADLDAINLAAPVQDGVQIMVPAKGVATAGVATGAAGGGGSAPGAPAAPVDLNTATEEQLDTLDGVGPATAAKILDYRRQHGGFRSIDDLIQVPGIGPKKFAALKGKVRT
jgi:competence protein ComEA